MSRHIDVAGKIVDVAHLGRGTEHGLDARARRGQEVLPGVAAACVAWLFVCHPRDIRHVGSTAGAAADRPVGVSAVHHGAAADVRVLFCKSEAAWGADRMVLLWVQW